jgi:phosphoglycerate dehydrogenase-like enzyme
MEPMRVLLHYAAGPAWQRDLGGLAAQGLVVDCCDELDDERFHALLPQAEVLWHVLRPISAGDIARAARLRLIQKIGVGVNTIDLEAARSRGIAVCNMPGTNTRAVVEMTLLLMLACLRRLPFLDRETRGGRGWKIDRSVQDDLGEIGGRTVGLVGYGAVARALTPILQAMGAKVIYSGREPKPGVDLVYRDLESLLREADIVSLHLPLTPETAGLLDGKRLALLGRDSILVNTARGGLVDQDALADALRNGRIGAAGLDVFADEPVSGTQALLALPNVVVTPHLAWLTGETLSRSLGLAVENCSRLREARELIHRVV